ncbi:DNRLRE domain-containing protein [Streptomyces sp. NPDC046977]|uniref:DNRLRE domain-containing protein n=1 Tax=Streptomyces sp. NPDC046977 TaxID=3154703 RepID=UPI0033E803C7
MDGRWLRLPRTRRRAGALLATAVAAVLGLTQLPALHHADAPQHPGAPSAPVLLDEDTAVAKARSSGERVEVTALRDANTTTYALPNGSFELTSRAIAFRAKVGGVWKPIDTDLRRTKDGGWAPKAVNNPAVFSAGRRSADAHASRSQARTALTTGTAGEATSSDLVTWSTDGHQLTLTWPAALPAPVVDGPRALYQDVLPGVDLLLTARDAGFSHVLIVKDADAAANPELAHLSYGLTSPDLAFTLDPVTHVVHAKDSSGREIAVSPTPYMWDSAGKPAVTEGDDPQPPRPSEEPPPSTGPDVDPPADDPADSPDPSSHTPYDETDAAFRDSTRGGAGPAVRPAAFTTGSDSASVLALPGLAGPQPGTHDALAQVTLSGGTALSLTPDAKLLTDDSTVYPVFIDPSFTGHTNNWTTAYQPHPSSSFWNGNNFNDGTDTARVGYESTTAGLSRSFFQLALSTKLKGAAVSSASFYALETYSWSCSARGVQLWRTSGISSATTWNNQPSWTEQINAQNVAHGYNSSCPDNWVNFPATSLGQDAANNGWSSVTVGLRAADETSSYPWKKFEASSSNSPYLKITYNHKPVEPTKLAMTPGPDCEATPSSSVGNSDLTFAATSSDPDGDLKYLDFEVWQDGATTKIIDGNYTVDANGHASITVAAAKFANGKVYRWTVRAIDSTGTASSYAPPGTGNCLFTYDSSKPNPPGIDSTDFPEDDGTGTVWSTKTFGNEGTFTLSPAGSKDTTTYLYSVNGGFYDHSKTVAKGASTTVSVAPKVAGPNVLYVKAVDGAGNQSAAATYLFYVSPSDHEDAPGDVTGDALPDLYVIDQIGNLRLYAADKTGDIQASIPAAYKPRSTLADGYWTDPDGNPALITHNGDFLKADGITDLIARMPDNDNNPDNGADPGLFIYPGDGYGSFDITQRTEVFLPDKAVNGETVPAPGAYDQILAVGDIDKDGRPDMFATSGNQYWAFLGYTGGAFSQAVLQNTATAWPDRDLVSVGDHNNDGALDLVYRVRQAGQLRVRYGIKDSHGGTTLLSLSNGTPSLLGVDTNYPGIAWSKDSVPMIAGTPDINGDGIPDIWAVLADTSVHVYIATPTTPGSDAIVITSGWDVKKALG